MNTNRLFVCTSIGLILVACSTKQDKPQYEPIVVKIPREPEKLNYSVSEGDTVGSIARSHNMSRAELIQINNLTPPYELYAGQKLIVKQNTQSEREVIDYRDPAISNKYTSELNSSTDDASIEIVQEGGLKTEGEEQSTRVDDTKEIIEDKIDDVQLDRYAWPIDRGKERIVQKFNDTNGFLLIQAPGGTPVKSIANGVVKFAGKAPEEANNQYGNMVVISHPELHKLSIYARLKNIIVKRGQTIKLGNKIGEVSVIKNKKPQLYFEIDNTSSKNKRVPINPEKLLP